MISLESLSIAYITYLIGSASPGPANLAIMQASLEKGRSTGLALAFGVVTVSIFWGIFVAVGLVAVIVETPAFLHALSMIGGSYLLWMSYGNIKKLLADKSPTFISKSNKQHPKELFKSYTEGLMIHLTNPKAVLVWLSIILLGTSDSDHVANSSYWVVFGCALIGACVFCGYALLFSSKEMILIYTKTYKPFTIIVALLFFITGVLLLYQPLKWLYL